MDLIFDISGWNDEKDEFSTSKQDVLKFLKIIGVDTRFISYTPQKIYINNLRFSKFSRKRETIFNKHYNEIKVIRSSLFQKICSKASRVLALEIKPNSTILMPKDNFIVELIMEPYTRKYGAKLVYNGKYDLKVNPIILDDKVNEIFASIFKGQGLKFNKNSSEIYPLINVPLAWINSFLKMNDIDKIQNENNNELANSFMEFLEDITPQYRENVLKASKYIESKNMSL